MQKTAQRTRYKSIIITVGLITLMMFAVMCIVAITGLFKPNAVYAKIMGILVIAAGACLSLNAATTILDKPKESVRGKYRQLALAIVVATAALVLLWLIVLFVVDMGKLVGLLNQKKYTVGTAEGQFIDIAAAKAARDADVNALRPHLFIVELTIALTIIVAYFNLIVTRRYVLKNRLVPIQVCLYFGAFIFYFWFLMFFITIGFTYSEKADQWCKLFLRPSLSLVINPLGYTLLFSGIVVYLIARFASIGSMRRFKNEGLFDERNTASVADVKEAISENKVEATPTPVQAAPVQETSSTDDVKARIQKLKELRDEGLITDEEFEKKKKDIIDSL